MAGKFDVTKIREDFPILSQKYPGKPLIYLDSAATSQHPVQVIDTIADFYKNKNASVSRGLYRIAEEATFEYEQVRQKVARFINAPKPEAIIFTKNTTESANIIMAGWGRKFVKKGDKIVITRMEHHSNFVPWQQLAKETGAELGVVELTESNKTSEDAGLLDTGDAEKKLKGAKLFAFSGASNVLGTINDVKELTKLAHENGALAVIDGAQSVPSSVTDVKKSECDFLMFSGHKMLAPFGVGVLYGKPDLLEKTDPFIYGSSMIRTVRDKKTEWADVPAKFEAGTPDVGSVLGLGTAIDYLNRIGMDKVESHEHNMASYMTDSLSNLHWLRMLGPTNPKFRTGLLSFTIEGVHPHDVAAILAEDNLCVRSGHHCAMPLHESLGISASTRASTYIYTMKSEIDALVDALVRAKKLFS